MGSVLFLGFLIGIQHALEADHVAAVASLASRTGSLRAVVRQGAVWGLGHGLTLLLFGGAVLLFDRVVPETLARALEVAVGVMLVILGASVLRRLVHDRIHFHRHRHSDGVVHMHAHSHAGEHGTHDPERHAHGHPEGLPLRPLFVGMMHGMAGSAALLLLALASVQSAALGFLYVLLFGLGSVLGMAALSAVIAVPLTWSARVLTWGRHALQAAIGGATLLIGGAIVYQAGVVPWLAG